MNINITQVRNALGPRVNVAALRVQQRSPEIMTGAGIIFGLAGAVSFAKAYKRHDETLGETLNQIQDAKEQIAEGNELYESLDPKQRADATDEFGLHHISKREELILMRGLYLQTAGDFIKLYGPPILLGVVSVLLITGGHRQLQKRNRAIAALLAVTQQGFATYRGRVRDELGQDADNRFYYGLTKRQTKTVVTDENGKKKRIKGEENVLDEDPTPIMYQRVLGPDNKNWGDIVTSNYFWLGGIQRMMNEKLLARGWVSLNEVYDALGFDETPEGQVVGWSLAKCQTEGHGDKFIDIGADADWNLNREGGTLLLDFNVNGPFFDWIDIPWDQSDPELGQR